MVLLTHDYPTGHRIPLHFHDRDQLVYASSGVMTVSTGDGTWVVPTLRAVWIPEYVPHTISMSGAVAMRTVYLKPKLARTMPRDCCVVNVSPLLRELILHACCFGSLRPRVERHRHLMETILDQLEAIQTVPLQLRNLSDTRAERVARTLIANPGDCRTLEQLSKGSGASRRTVERLFQEELGMTFGRWRQQLRLDAWNATAGRGFKSHTRRSGSRLQHAQCVYFGVSKGAGNNAGGLLRSSSKDRRKAETVGDSKTKMPLDSRESRGTAF